MKHAHTHTHAYTQKSPPLLLPLSREPGRTEPKLLESCLGTAFALCQPHTTQAYASWLHRAVGDCQIPQPRVPTPTLGYPRNLHGVGRELSREAACQSRALYAQVGFHSPDPRRAVTGGRPLVTITGEVACGGARASNPRYPGFPGVTHLHPPVPPTHSSCSVLSERNNSWHLALAVSCIFPSYFLAMPSLLLLDYFATTVSSWERGTYTSSIFFENIYFIGNNDRHLIASSQKPSDLCLQAGASLTVFVDLTDGFLPQILFDF